MAVKEGHNDDENYSIQHHVIYHFSILYFSSTLFATTGVVKLRHIRFINCLK